VAFALLAGALLAAPSSVAAQEIEGQYIVVLKEGATGVSADRAMGKVRVRGGQVQHTYTSALKGFSAKLDARALAAVKADPAVDYVEQDRVVTLDATQNNPPWGLDRIDQRTLPLSSTYTYDFTGAGVTAYIIDTGIRFSHSQFGGRAVTGYDAIDGGSADDCNGHGTHVAGTVGGSTYGVAKGVRLVGVRVLNCSGSGSNSGVIAGIDWVRTNHTPEQPAVANMSLGGGASSAVDTAVRNAIADGVTFAVAAGNSNANACNSSPARTAEALTVGATTQSDARSSFSNYGTCLDVFAPGSGVTSAWHTSDSAANTISGTSMAAPHVAGVAALVTQEIAGASPATVMSTITSRATTGAVSNPGSGSPNRLLYSLAGGSPPPPPPPPPPTCPGTTYGGNLSGPGDTEVEPNGTYYQSTVSGTHRGCLTGPASADFDLYLLRWNGFSWSIVARAEGPTSTESISYNGTAGYYYWRVQSYSGSGNYTLIASRP
jgi:subtilisin family serine protease